MSIFKGKRPRLMQSFMSSGHRWEVLSVSHCIIIGRKFGMIKVKYHHDLITVREICK